MAYKDLKLSQLRLNLSPCPCPHLFWFSWSLPYLCERHLYLPGHPNYQPEHHFVCSFPVPHQISPQVPRAPSGLAFLPRLPVPPTPNILSLPIQSHHSQWLLHVSAHKIFHVLIPFDLTCLSHLATLKLSAISWRYHVSDLCTCCSRSLECLFSPVWLGELLIKLQCKDLFQDLATVPPQPLYLANLLLLDVALAQHSLFVL